VSDCRHLDWDGCLNVRDLGGLRTADGRETRWGAVVRSDAPDQLSPKGWAALREHGIRTIVDLRNDEERAVEPEPLAAGLTMVHEPIDDIDDIEFWRYCRDNRLDGTPLYYLPFLERAGKAERCAAVVAAIARAEPGGVLVHCGIGRDRTGLITLLLLALVGVSPEDIAADYELSHDRLEPLRVGLGGPSAREALARRNTSASEVIEATLASIDVASYLRDAGLGDEELRAIRARLLG
jgi:protein-tyrosine phosphatase